MFTMAMIFNLRDQFLRGLKESSDVYEVSRKNSEQQQVVTLRVCASRWTEVCGGIGSQRMQQRKMAPLLKITIVLVICSIFVECR